MADQPNVFNDTPAVVPPATPVIPAQVDNTLDTLLDEIRNEQGQRKYATLQDAITGLKNAQDYIPTIKSQLTQKEQELDQLKVELAKRESVEDVVARLTAARQDNQEATPSSGLDQQTVEALIQSTIQAREANLVASANEKQVNDTLIAKFGDKAKEVVVAKAEELGISVKDLGLLSQRSPKAVLAYFDVKPNQSTTPNLSSVNTSQFQGKPQPAVVPRPEKSVLSGVSNRVMADHLQEHKRAVYAKLGIEE